MQRLHLCEQGCCSTPLAICSQVAHPRNDELSAKVLHLRLDLAADVELVAVEGDALQVGQQVLLAGRIRALEGEGAEHRAPSTAAPDTAPVLGSH